MGRRCRGAAAVGTVSGSRRDWLEGVENSGPAPELAALRGGGSRLQDPGIRSPSLLRPPLGPRGLPPTAFSQPCPSPSAPAGAQTFPGSLSLRPQTQQTHSLDDSFARFTLLSHPFHLFLSVISPCSPLSITLPLSPPVVTPRAPSQDLDHTVHSQPPASERGGQGGLWGPDIQEGGLSAEAAEPLSHARRSPWTGPVQTQP